MQNAEIEREPDAPKMTDTLQHLLTELCFRKDDPQDSDWIFVFGSFKHIDQLIPALDSLLSKNISNKVMISGGPTGPNKEIESELIVRDFDTSRYPHIQFFTEKVSTNTLANVTESLKISDFAQTKNITFLFKCHAAGRGYLTLRKFFPTSEIFQSTYPTEYEGITEPLTSTNWYTNENYINRVWGEYLRIKKYGQRGDIAYDEVRELVEKIDEVASLAT